LIEVRVRRVVEFVVRGGQCVSQLLDAICTKDDRSHCRIR
jgi:hypothetical protein